MRRPPPTATSAVPTSNGRRRAWRRCSRRACEHSGAGAVRRASRSRRPSSWVAVRILVLGGTRFLGRAFVAAALGRGHSLTLFNRGRTNPELFPGVERIAGDRDGGLGALAGRTWDAVLDPSGFFPRVVGASARAVSGSVGRYLFVSSISVYAEPIPRGADETAPVAPLADPTVEDIV